MEEADVLSDRIIVVSDGTLKAIGTPLYLKNNHGNTYRLSIILESGEGFLSVAEACAIMQSMFPSSTSITADSNSIIVGVSSANINEL